MKTTRQNFKILSAVELGSPAADCAHFGICSIEEVSPEQWNAFQPRHMRHVKAVISVTSDAQLQFEFPLEGMRADTRLQFFPEAGFRVDSAFVVPEGISEALGFSGIWRTLPKVYALKTEQFSIVLQLALALELSGFAHAA